MGWRLWRGWNASQRAWLIDDDEAQEFRRATIRLGGWSVISGRQIKPRGKDRRSAGAARFHLSGGGAGALGKVNWFLWMGAVGALAFSRVGRFQPEEIPAARQQSYPQKFQNERTNFTIQSWLNPTAEGRLGVLLPGLSKYYDFHCRDLLALKGVGGLWFHHANAKDSPGKRTNALSFDQRVRSLGGVGATCFGGWDIS